MVIIVDLTNEISLRYIVDNHKTKMFKGVKKNNNKIKKFKKIFSEF